MQYNKELEKRIKKKEIFFTFTDDKRTKKEKFHRKQSKKQKTQLTNNFHTQLP